MSGKTLLTHAHLQQRRKNIQADLLVVSSVVVKELEGCLKGLDDGDVCAGIVGISTN